MFDVGFIARSNAGHDKKRYYVIVALEGEFAFIVDGKERRLARPKKKNLKHLSVTHKRIDPNQISSDRYLREILEPMNQILKQSCKTVGGK